MEARYPCPHCNFQTSDATTALNHVHCLEHSCNLLLFYLRDNYNAHMMQVHGWVAIANGVGPRVEETNPYAAFRRDPFNDADYQGNMDYTNYYSASSTGRGQVVAGGSGSGGGGAAAPEGPTPMRWIRTARRPDGWFDCPHCTYFDKATVAQINYHIDQMHGSENRLPDDFW